jgi:hypothetical protein
MSCRCSGCAQLNIAIVQNPIAAFFQEIYQFFREARVVNQEGFFFSDVLKALFTYVQGEENSRVGLFIDKKTEVLLCVWAGGRGREGGSKSVIFSKIGRY